MSPKLAAILRKIEAGAAAGVWAGCSAVAQDVRRNAGKLAPGVEAGRLERSGKVVACAVESGPVDGAPPPAVREFGSFRSPPHAYMRPACGPRGKATMDRAMVESLPRG